MGNGGVKKSKTYEQDSELNGYVLTLQKFDNLIKEGIRNKTIVITENTIKTDKNFDL
ncbi:MAG: hypothetical protein IJ150_04345 [Bacteroidales bacterium]|nr:hypothetical protein [Bacteroidales bacterium]